jgi:DNA (cytosine-5)-methyltransferase 1
MTLSTKNKSKKLNTISLFTGCGGLDLGFRSSGFNIVLINDSWDKAIETYQANHTELNYEIISGDISKKEISRRIITSAKKQKIDLVIGGPPCQEFSSAGGRNANGKKANLTPQFAELVCQISPKWVVMENVNTLRSIGDQQLKKCKDIFQKAGYGITILILNAADFGVPQKRKRLILIGHLNGIDNEMLPFIEKQKKKEKTIREFMPDILQGSTKTEFYYRHPRTYARRGIFSIDELSPTIRGVNRPIPKTYKTHKIDATKDVSKVRALTTEERARVQSFPKNFKIIGNKGEKETQIGNAVPPLLAKAIANAINEFEKFN